MQHPKPDVEMFHEESGRIFFGGRIYDVVRMADGWLLTFALQFDKLYVAPSVEDICAWLMAQQTV